MQSTDARCVLSEARNMADMGSQTSTPKDTPELGIMAATSLSTNPRDYVNKEHWRPLAWTQTSGESMSNVRIHPPYSGPF